MRAICLFALAVIALTLFGVSAPVRADSVLLSNLIQPAQVTNTNPYVGQSFIAGTVDEPLYGAQMQLDPTKPPDSGLVLEVEARNANGTVGATLYSNFSSSFNSTTGLVTFTANSPFELRAGTGYWLVLSDPSAGGVTWDFTASNVYQSEYGYGLPSYNTSWFSNADNGQGNSTYYQPSDGPQLFDLIAPATASVSEPSSVLLVCIPLGILVVATGVRRARACRAR
jgi:hypothetical protein